MSKRKQTKTVKTFGTCLLETEALKKGMSLISNWRTRHLRLFDTKDGLVLAYYKDKESLKPKGHLRIKPHGKVHEIDHPGKRKNVLTVAAVDGRQFTCAMPDASIRAQWASVIREETDNAFAVADKSRRLSQSTEKMNPAQISKLGIKVVSRVRYKKEKGAKPKRKQTIRQQVQEHGYAFDFGIFNFETGKWAKLWSKTQSDKEWEQAHEKIRKSGMFNLYGSDSIALKYPEHYGSKSDSVEKKRETRALDIELCLDAIFNLVDINAIKANAAPWVCAIACPQLHEALQMPAHVRCRLCRLGYRRKVMVFGEDPNPELTGDFDLDNPAAASGAKIQRKPTKNFKPVVVYSGVLWKKPTSGGLGKGRKRWFSLRRTEIGTTAVLEYFEDPHEKCQKGKMIIDESCELLLGTSFCMSGRWRFCIKSGAKAVEAQAGSEKEFGTWVLHILRYTYNQNRLSAVSPKASSPFAGASPTPDDSPPSASKLNLEAAAAPASARGARTLIPNPHETPRTKSPEAKSEGAAAAAAADAYS